MGVVESRNKKAGAALAHLWVDALVLSAMGATLLVAAKGFQKGVIASSLAQAKFALGWRTSGGCSPLMIDQPKSLTRHPL